jgi:pyruvate/2-oxoglutarate dehydrogenase complex dihydrolipoamide acyltransferase (E2) component
VVSLWAVQDELVLDDDGTVPRRSYLNLAMTYDHRLINGAVSMLFLSELRASLESRPSVERLLGR